MLDQDTSTRVGTAGPGVMAFAEWRGSYMPGSIIELSKTPKTEPMKTSTSTKKTRVYTAVSSRIPNIRLSPFPN